MLDADARDACRMLNALFVSFTWFLRFGSHFFRSSPPLSLSRSLSFSGEWASCGSSYMIFWWYSSPIPRRIQWERETREEKNVGGSFFHKNFIFFFLCSRCFQCRTTFNWSFRNPFPCMLLCVLRRYCLRPSRGQILSLCENVSHRAFEHRMQTINLCEFFFFFVIKRMKWAKRIHKWSVYVSSVDRHESLNRNIFVKPNEVIWIRRGVHIRYGNENENAFPEMSDWLWKMNHLFGIVYVSAERITSASSFFFIFIIESYALHNASPTQCHSCDAWNLFNFSSWTWALQVQRQRHLLVHCELAQCNFDAMPFIWNELKNLNYSPYLRSNSNFCCTRGDDVWASDD